MLHCDGISAGEIAGRFGTPCYVYSSGLLRERFARMSGAFARWDALVCFSVKSLGNLAVLRLLAECGSGFDVVSGGELYRVLQAGGEASKTVFAGVGKTRAEIEEAIGCGVRMFNVECAGELRTVESAAAELGRKAVVAIRVNPDVDANTHARTTTGTKENKFGLSISATERLIQEAADYRNVEVRGLHVHLGSPIYSVDPYVRALERLSGLALELREQGCPINVINMGGGYCISYTGEQVPGPEQYAAALQPLLEKLGCEVIIEPGRYIAGPSGVLLARVLYGKESEHGKRFLICDAAMTDLVRPTLYEAFHRIWPVESPDGLPERMTPDDRGCRGIETRIVDVVGPVCESGDFFARARPLPPVEEGDLLAVFDAGAYGFTMSSNYNARPRPCEVMVTDGRAALVRQRETYEDLVGAEKAVL